MTPSKRVNIKTLRGSREQTNSRTGHRHTRGFGRWGLSGARGGRRLRAQRRRRRLLFAGLAVLVLSIVLALLAWVSHHERLVINEVRVSGTEVLATPVVAAFVAAELDDGKLHFVARDNIFLYPKDAVENALAETFPRVAQVEISRQSLLGQGLLVSITEREPYARWCKDGNDACYLIDRDGLVFAAQRDESQTTEPYIFTGGSLGNAVIGERVLPLYFMDVRTFLEELTVVDVAPRRIEIINEHDFEVLPESGPRIRVSFAQLGDTLGLIGTLRTVLESEALEGRLDEISYIDLRFGDKVYYK